MANRPNEILVSKMITDGVLKTPEIIDAFKKIDRRDFVSEETKNYAYEDLPIFIPSGMTTSQPSTIAFMLELLKPRRGEKIMEVGTGSGYVTALLARLVGPEGKIFSIDVMPELKEFAGENLKKYNFKNIRLYSGDGKKGIPESAPYDKIISGAEIGEIPFEWKKQLKEKGVIVTPLDGHVLRAVKASDKSFKEDKFPYFSFLRMI